MTNTRSFTLVMRFMLVSFLFTLRVGLAQDSEKRIVFMSDRDGNREIYTMNPDGSEVLRLTNDPAEDIEPAWSPNYEQIAFVSNRAGVSAIYVMEADGTNVKRVTKDDTGRYSGSPSWSPSGRQLVIVSNVSGTNQIYTVNIDGSGLRQLTSNTGESINPSWSPDGRQIAFVSNEGGNYEVYAVDLNGGNLQQLTADEALDVDSVAWSPDGQQIAFSGFDSLVKSGELYVMNVDGSGLRLLTSLLDTFIYSPTWSSDGAQIAYVVASANRYIQVMDVNSSSINQIFTLGETNVDFPDWAAPIFLETVVEAEVELTCQTTAQRLAANSGDTVIVSCPANCSTGNIWGTDIYTDDSAICIAAIHAGLFEQQGGIVTVAIRPGQTQFQSSRRHGILSGRWGPWGRSFSLADPYGNNPVVSSAFELTCNDTAQMIRGSAGTSIEVSCPADCPNRSIWGTQIYTDDSVICTAARHAGIIDSSAGSFELTILGAQSTYSASQQNGVQSGAWGRWLRSFSLRQTSSG